MMSEILGELEDGTEDCTAQASAGLDNQNGEVVCISLQPCIKNGVYALFSLDYAEFFAHSILNIVAASRRQRDEQEVQ